MTTMTKHKTDSQVMLILNHLQTGAEINPLEALSRYGVYRLGAAIFILKGEGYHILSRLHTYEKPNGKRGRYAVYKLVQKEERKDA